MQLYENSRLGTIFYADLIIKDYTVNVGEKTLFIDLVQLEIQGWDVILRTD